MMPSRIAIDPKRRPSQSQHLERASPDAKSPLLLRNTGSTTTAQIVPVQRSVRCESMLHKSVSKPQLMSEIAVAVQSFGSGTCLLMVIERPVQINMIKTAGDKNRPNTGFTIGV